MRKGIDAHIHLESYEPDLQERMIAEMPQAGVCGLIAVSMDLKSSEKTSVLAKAHPGLVYPAYGFHPEQTVPDQEQQDRLFAWIKANATGMVAVGEVGLPYYLRQEKVARGEQLALEPYTELLERFIVLAKELEKPIILHAVYEDAAIACDLLEKHGVDRAHFHWYKGDRATTERMIKNGYFISLTPDLLYEQEIQQLADVYPLAQLMVETDGPWPFEGPFTGQMTHPAMIAHVLEQLAVQKGLSVQETADRIYANTCAFYRIKA